MRTPIAQTFRAGDPLDVVRDAGLSEVHTKGECSYVFDGGSGSLDHLVATSSLHPKITGRTIWDIGPRTSVAATATVSDAEPFREGQDHLTGTRIPPGRRSP